MLESKKPKSQKVLLGTTVQRHVVAESNYDCVVSSNPTPFSTPRITACANHFLWPSFLLNFLHMLKLVSPPVSTGFKGQNRAHQNGAFCVSQPQSAAQGYTSTRCSGSLILERLLRPAQLRPLHLAQCFSPGAQKKCRTVGKVQEECPLAQSHTPLPLGGTSPALSKQHC